MHPIKRYCEGNQISQRAFARLTVLSEGYVSQLISGRDSIGKQAALRIVSKTGGEITLAELLTWTPDESSVRAAS